MSIKDFEVIKKLGKLLIFTATVDLILFVFRKRHL